jgi:hypothetical protein
MREEGEDASATVELAILLPVYLLLVVALLTIGQLVLVRQGMILGTRNVAWRPTGGSVPVSEGNAPITNSFIPLGNPSAYGQFSAAAPTISDVKFVANGGSPEVSLTVASADQDRVQDSSGASSSSGLSGNDAQTLAAAVMNDDQAKGPHLQRSQADGQFQYHAGWLPMYFASSYTPKTRCVVYSRKDPTQGYERTVYTNQDHHPIEDLIGSKGSSNGFSITKDMSARFFPPIVPDPNNTNESGVSLQPGNIGEGSGKDPGIWDSSTPENPGFRIGGSVQQERQFFYQQWQSSH